MGAREANGSGRVFSGATQVKCPDSHLKPAQIQFDKLKICLTDGLYHKRQPLLDVAPVSAYPKLVQNRCAGS